MKKELPAMPEALFFASFCVPHDKAVACKKRVAGKGPVPPRRRRGGLQKQSCGFWEGTGYGKTASGKAGLRGRGEGRQSAGHAYYRAVSMYFRTRARAASRQASSVSFWAERRSRGMASATNSGLASRRRAMA